MLEPQTGVGANNNQPKVSPPLPPTDGPAQVPEAPQSTIVAAAIPPSHKKALMVGLASLAILLVLTGGYWLTQRSNGLKIGSSTYHYSKVETVKLPGDRPGQGLSFTKPTEFYDPSQQATSKQHLNLYGFVVRDHYTQIDARISATSVVSEKHTDKFFKSYQSILLDPSGTYYEAAVDPLKQTIKTRLPGNYNLSYGPAEAFSSSNIKEHAWKIKFSATRKDNDKNSPAKLEGQAIMAIRETATYFLVEAAEASNWQANQKTWQQVAQSLKVDL